MPVLSSQRSSGAAISSTYRSSFSPSVERSLYFYNPRVSSYTSEKYNSRLYGNNDRRHLVSRFRTFPEETVKRRFLDDSRDSSLIRESNFRHCSVTRESSVLDSSTSTDVSSVLDSSKSSTSGSVLDSLVDLRNKYSPSNYVPAIYRKVNHSSRSKSVNDIGLPPIENKKVDINDLSTFSQVTVTNSRNGTSPSLANTSINTRIKPDAISALNRSSPSNPKGTSADRETFCSEDDFYDSSVKAKAGNFRNRSQPPNVRNKIAERQCFPRHQVSNIRNKSTGLKGLRNIGNTCFMNSVIQCLSNTKLLLEYIRNDSYLRDINNCNSSMNGALIRAFAEVLKEIWSEDIVARDVNTSSLKCQLQKFAPRFMGYAQQDAQEFLRYLLEGLHEDVNRITEKNKVIYTEIDDNLCDLKKSLESWSRYLRADNSRIVDIFVGQLKSTLKCTFCGHCSVTFDPFWDLSLPLPQRTGQLRLTQCLEAFTHEETLDGNEKPMCAKCKERRRCTKSFSIQKFPKILVIHLKRFSQAEKYKNKLNITVDFPLDGLDMSKFAAEGVTTSKYDLYAVSNHSGTPFSGHYTAYCRHPYNQSWHEYNDSIVTTASPRSVVSSEAYVLFYEQVK